MPSVKVNADGSVTVGTADGDVLIALDGQDSVLIGGAGADTLIGGSGDDILNGGSGDDSLSGNGGFDLLLGGSGNDILNGGTDNDVLVGGSGADQYVFGADSGTDVILGFNTADDTIDLTAAGISDLTGLVTDDQYGNAVVDLGNGNSFTVVGTSAADLLANGNFVLAPPPPTGPQEVFLGVDDTYTDAGDGTDQIIYADNNGEAQTDTDTFIFGPNNGNDTITDFQENSVDFSSGSPVIIPGDSLDLSAYGIYGTDLTDTGYVGFLDSMVALGLLDSYTVTATDTVLNFDSGDSLTLLGIGEVEIGTVIEMNMVRDTGGA